MKKFDNEEEFMKWRLSWKPFIEVLAKDETGVVFDYLKRTSVYNIIEEDGKININGVRKIEYNNDFI